VRVQLKENTMQRRLPRTLIMMAMALGALVLACDTSMSLVEVDETQEFDFPPAGSGEEIDKETIEFGESFDPLESPELEDYGGTAAAVGEVFLEECGLSVLDGMDNLDFLSSVAFYVEAPGMSRVLLANKDSIPPGVKRVEMDVKDVDLADYVAAGALIPSMVVSGVDNAAAPTMATMEISFSLSMGVSLAGTCESIFE